MWQNQATKSSYRESLKALEADIQHANSLAAALPRDYDGDCVQMRLSYSPLAPLFLYLIEWMDYSCTDSLPGYLGLLHILVYKVYVDGIPSISSKERKATLREFYAVIYPSLRQLEGEFIELEDYNTRNQYGEGHHRKLSNKDIERDDECGICMEDSTKMSEKHLNYRNARSESCPFCRGSLKRVSSTDLWVLTSDNDVIDAVTLAKENLRRFYLYIENLRPFIAPDTHVMLFDYML
ncbi:RING/U-box superfamily protein [Parasponia andersonii]|uniref:RING/U-box superfamily protein n=1 Tax=Parasponia andersonii TaxID=3476 RepID=A0A2P5B0M7_PARAD|nr:RING/U-box superfamily protein [Parasponia andersonii]